MTISKQSDNMNAQASVFTFNVGHSSCLCEEIGRVFQQILGQLLSQLACLPRVAVGMKGLRTCKRNLGNNRFCCLSFTSGIAMKLILLFPGLLG